ncbi:hypothetical protein BD770DRAFT_139152 [Pilaira anomala]|nr:hypothetical protein BD770DRAFT_139152 [Pilaira anomala]
MSLESVCPAHPNDKCIFKILAHIINAYIENTEVFINPLGKVSELDFLMKVWSQVFELLFGNDKKLSINWGETVPETTTAVKRHNNNNNNKQNTIGCKVDGRIVCKLPKIVDTCHIEAAKATVTNAKLYSDKFKQAAECKCTLDDMIISGKLKGYKFVEIPGVVFASSLLINISRSGL